MYVCAAHLIVSVQMNSSLPQQFLPCNWITDEENICYPNSLLPFNIGTGPLCYLHAQHAYLYGTLTHRVGVVGIFFF